MLHHLWLLHHLWVLMLHEPGWIHGVLCVRHTRSAAAVVGLHEGLIKGAPNGDMIR